LDRGSGRCECLQHDRSIWFGHLVILGVLHLQRQTAESEDLQGISILCEQAIRSTAFVKSFLTIETQGNGVLI
jgi:hypothetical protein